MTHKVVLAADVERIAIRVNPMEKVLRFDMRRFKKCY
jgi:hypothetical protein